MTPRSAKAKGRRFQQEVRESILATFPQLEPEDVKVAIMGESGEDIKLSPAARKLFPFAVETKNVERLSIWSAIEQAKRNAGKHTPLLAFKKNRTEPWVALPMAAFMELARKAA